MHIHHVYKVCVYICFISLHVKLLNIILKCVHTHTLLRACYNTHISSIVCSVIDYKSKTPVLRIFISPRSRQSGTVALNSMCSGWCTHKKILLKY